MMKTRMNRSRATICLLTIGLVTMSCGDESGPLEEETQASEHIVLEGLEGFELHDDILVRKSNPLADGVGESAEALLATTSSNGRWGPNCRIPYAIDPGVPNPVRILQAIAQYELRTKCRLPPVVDPSIEDFVYFERHNETLACFSELGRRGGGKQIIGVNDGCGPNRLIHEIGHTIAFDHEQNRPDRNNFVAVHLENVRPDFQYQHSFDLNTVFSSYGSYYDYSSIMHYDDDKWAKAPGLKSMVRLDGYAIPRHYVLSQGDLGAIATLYPGNNAPPAIAAGDFDNDGKADIALTGGSWSGIPLSRSIVAGSIESNATPAQGLFPAWAQSPGVQVLSGDFNGDGRSDIALTGVSGWVTIPVARSNGDGTFNVTNFASLDFATRAATPGAQVLTGDFNGDHCTDIALTGVAGWTSVTLALSSCDGSFQVQYVPAPQFGAWSSTSGATTLVLHHKIGGDRIAVVGVPGLSTLPVGQFSFGGSWAFNVLPYQVDDFAAWSKTPNVRILAGDFNGDGFGDIALAGGQGWTTAPVAILGLASYKAIISNAPAGALAVMAPNSIARAVAADFDGDGRDDIALVVPGQNRIPTAFSRGSTGSLSWSVGFDSGSAPTFLAQAAFATTIAGSPLPVNAQILVGDFNGDKKADLALIGPNLSTLPLMTSVGDGTFTLVNASTDAVLWAQQQAATVVGRNTDRRQYPVAGPSAAYLHNIESPRVGVNRLYYPSTNEHFYTASRDEALNLAWNHGWTVEIWNDYYLRGDAEVYTDTNFGYELVPFYRCMLYWGKHLDTTSSSCEGVGYVEGLLGYIATGPMVSPLDATATDAAVPLYRLFSPSTGDHFFTTNSAELFSTAGYNFDLVAGYVFKSPGK